MAGEFTLLALDTAILDTPEHHLTAHLTECRDVELGGD